MIVPPLTTKQTKRTASIVTEWTAPGIRIEVRAYREGSPFPARIMVALWFVRSATAKYSTGESTRYNTREILGRVTYTNKSKGFSVICWGAAEQLDLYPLLDYCLELKNEPINLLLNFLRHVWDWKPAVREKGARFSLDHMSSMFPDEPVAADHLF